VTDNKQKRTESKQRKRPSGVKAAAVALQWLELGIAPVPLKPEQKRPKSKKGWNKIIVTTKTIKNHFEDGDNVGGLWGEPSGWIIDVDLDWDEAALVAPFFLPETFIYGRPSRPGTHFLFRCKGIKTFKRSTFGRDGEVIVEVRSTGTQSVLPPSIHPDGERFEIHHDVPFTSIGRKLLEAQVNKIAAASIFARAYPEGGGRHDFVHTLTGALSWLRWSNEDITTFMMAVLEAAEGRESDRPQRVNGWPTLRSWVGDEDLKQVRKWLTVAKLEEEAPIKKVEIKPDTVQIPPELLDVPGLVGDLMRWASRTSYTKQPLFALGAALTCMAMVSANRYLVESFDTPLQPFFMMLGPTSSGKDSAKDTVVEFCRRAKLERHLFSGFQSYHALLDVLGDAPNMGCWLWDEAARKLKTAGRASAGQDHQILTWTLDLYGKGRSIMQGLPGRKQSIKAIEHPFLVILAAAQPLQMIEAITVADVSTGLINRFILLDAGDSVPTDNYDRDSIFPSALESKIAEYHKVMPPKGKSFVKVGWESTKVFSRFRDFSTQCREFSGRQGGSGEVWGRSNQNALILAGLVAIGVDPHKPRITDEIAEWAIKFMEWSSTRWEVRMDDSASRSMIETNSKTIERIIRNPRAFLSKARPSEVPAIRRGLTPKSMLYRLNRNLKARDLEDTLAQLVESDVIGGGESHGVDVYWMKTEIQEG
jgi:hypothetical protein